MQRRYLKDLPKHPSSQGVRGLERRYLKDLPKHHSSQGGERTGFVDKSVATG